MTYFTCISVRNNDIINIKHHEQKSVTSTSWEKWKQANKQIITTKNGHSRSKDLRMALLSFWLSWASSMRKAAEWASSDLRMWLTSSFPLFHLTEHLQCSGRPGFLKYHRLSQWGMVQWIRKEIPTETHSAT